MIPAVAGQARSVRLVYEHHIQEDPKNEHRRAEARGPLSVFHALGMCSQIFRDESKHCPSLPSALTPVATRPRDLRLHCATGRASVKPWAGISTVPETAIRGPRVRSTWQARDVGRPCDLVETWSGIVIAAEPQKRSGSEVLRRFTPAYPRGRRQSPHVRFGYGLRPRYRRYGRSGTARGRRTRDGSGRGGNALYADRWPSRTTPRRDARMRLLTVEGMACQRARAASRRSGASPRGTEGARGPTLPSS